MSQYTLAQILQTDGAVGAFNVHNLEFIRGVVQAAEQTGRPAILMINEAVLRYGTIPVLGGAALAAARQSSVPLAVMVDHGTHMDLLRQALDAGLDVMYDGSALPFEQNVENTRAMADYAHARGRSLEGEIGALGLSEDGDETHARHLTSVDEAVAFAKASGVDVLAVSVGNVHGFYQGTPHIDVPRIQAIADAVAPLPVVMHGGSDLPDSVVQASIRAGIRKFNIATDLKAAYVNEMCRLAALPEPPIQPMQLFPALTDAVARVAAEKIRLFSLA